MAFWGETGNYTLYNKQFFLFCEHWKELLKMEMKSINFGSESYSYRQFQMMLSE